jgi:hypothetical protein
MIRLTFVRIARRLPVAAALLALAPSVSAQAATIPVSNAAAFDTAVAQAQAGDVIQLADADFPPLMIRRHPWTGTVRIVGTHNTHLNGLVIKDSSNIELDGVAVQPTNGQRSTLSIENSSFVTVDGVLFDGVAESAGTGINMNPGATDVIVRNSEFTNCGYGFRCFALAGTRVTLANSNFHDCYDCDFVRGGGQYLTITGNTFDRAVPGTCTGGVAVCPHNDLMQIMGGGHYQIVGNHFGARSAGAAQLFIASGEGKNPTAPDDLYVANNTFDGGHMTYAIRVMQVPLPTNVRIVNNTVLTGDTASILLDPHYASLPVSSRPLIANNIFNKTTKVNCPLAQWTSNVSKTGYGCATTDQVGDPQLDANELPTALSTLVLDLADATLAPSTDKLGHPRLPLPDRGAFQLIG